MIETMTLQARVTALEAENGQLRAELARIRKDRTAYAHKRSHGIILGTWEPFADAGPLRDHIQAVTAATGISVNAFAKIAGVDWNTIGAIMDGSRDQVRTSSANAILAVTPDTVEATATDARVDSTGSMRRLRALTVKGWSLTQIAAQSDVAYAVLQLIRTGRKPLIAAKTRRRIAAAYSELADKEPPERTRGEKISARRTRATAHPSWAPVGAWDESFIDDPAAKPRLDWVRKPDQGKRRYGASAELTEDLHDLMRLGGLSQEEAAARLGISDGYAGKLLAGQTATPGEAA